MKKILLGNCVCLLILVGCSKSNDNSTSSASVVSSGIPLYVKPVDGSLKTNVSSLSLHKNSTASIVAYSVLANGTVTAATSLVWQSSDNAIATVSNGVVSSKGVGNCEVTVTDGIHGILSINVSVLPDSIAISSKATQVNWSFKNDVVIIKPKSNFSVAGYKVYDAKGALVNTTVSFVTPTGSGLTFSGNTVTSDTTLGSFDVIVTAGSDTLSGALKVVVASAVSKDTSYTIARISGPLAFYKTGVTANRPLIINVIKSWYNANGVLNTSNFTTSPDKIDFYDNAVRVNEQGFLVSQNVTKYINGARTDVFYKGIFGMYPLPVYINIGGSWGVNMSNGDQYNYCISQSGQDITYGARVPKIFDLTPLDPLFISGTYYFVRNGKEFLFGSTNLFTGLYWPQDDAIQRQDAIHIFHDGQSSSANNWFRFNNDNSICLWLSSPSWEDINFARDAGNCTVPTNTSSLELVLTNNTSKIWYPDSVMQLYDSHSLQFLSNHTYDYLPHSSDYSNLTWKVTSDNKLLTLHTTFTLTNPTEVDDYIDSFYISSYNADTLFISSIHDAGDVINMGGLTPKLIRK